ncbi:MAG: response regulator [Proteobacteria bacterium]|nr:response regulator [Pseudomonadota bacterium]
MGEIFEGKGRVLVVDDSPDVIAFCHEVLRNDFQVRAAASGTAALKLLRSGAAVDLVLLDVMMGSPDGFAVLREMQATPALAGLPVIFLTALSDTSDETDALRRGAVDFIRKPISGEVLMARVRNHVELKRARDYLRHHNERLEEEVARRTAENELIQDITIQTLASLAETRDNETGNHILRTKHCVRLLALELRRFPRDQALLTDAQIALFFKSAPLHDIGKVGVPDRVLLKPGPLNAEEWEEMKKHARYGREAIERAEAQLGVTAEFLRVAKDIACSHHERWDGAGYPDGLAGEAIPLSARLMAPADVYDALISRRCYKAPMPHREVVELVAAGRGTQFDPLVIDAFLNLTDEFEKVSRRYADPPEPAP